LIDDQRDVVDYLSSPAAYGRGVGTVTRIDTHSASIFLAGNRAYKLKRAVRFSYLDYSTPALRERFCRAELELNRRTAPTLYLDVVPIVRSTSGALSIGGNGIPVDWLVLMRRFDQDNLLDRLADAGRLTRPLVLELADHIVQFHSSAERVFDEGGYAGLLGVIKINEENLAQAVPSLLDPSAVLSLRDITSAALSRSKLLLERRKAAGRVRRCHGDMHLGNICLIDGRPTLFDCIEFNRSIACTDVLYDLAFLIMDLEHRSLRALGNAVLNRYLDLADETDGLPLLPLLLSLRASVRAHVSIAAARTQKRPDEVEGRITLAREYLGLALRLLVASRPQLVAIGGLSGTGKSTLAYGLAPDLGAVPGARVLRSDVLRKRLKGIAPGARLPDEAYATRMTQEVYSGLNEAAAAALAAGHSVIVDAVFAQPAERAAIAATARAAGVPFIGLWLEAPPKLLAERIQARKDDASDATVSVLQRQLTYDLGPMDWIPLDASGDTATCLAAARAVLSARHLPSG